MLSFDTLFPTEINILIENQEWNAWTLLTESRTKSTPSKISRHALWIAANTDSKRICSGPNRSEYSLESAADFVSLWANGEKASATWKTNKPPDWYMHVQHSVCCPLKEAASSIPPQDL